MRSLFASVALLLAAGCGTSGSGSGELPALAVRNLGPGSESTTLDALSESPMVLNLWAPWCPPCRAEMPDFDTVARAHPEITFVGLATGTEEDAAAEFAAEVGVSYALYYDIEDEALTELGVAGLPATVFIDETGRIVATHHGALTAPALESQLSDHLLADDGG